VALVKGNYADEINLSDLDFWRRPWEEREYAFATLRRERPISFYEEPVIEGTAFALPKGAGYYALTRYRDIATVSRHPEVFLSGPGAISQFDLPPEMVEYFSGLISTDNPRHTRLRRIIAHAFSPHNIRRVEESITQVADRVLTRAIDSGSGDFMTDIAAPLPLEIICSMMGVPPSEHTTVLECSNVILSNGDHEYVPEGTDPVVALLEAGGTLNAIMQEIGKFRLEHPIDDITSALVNAEIDSERLTQQELASFFVELVIAGTETTRTAIGHGLIALTDYPDQRMRLISDFDLLVKTGTNEIVRWATPIIWMRRTLATDYTLSNVRLKAGDKVLLFYNSANRDEEAFEDPYLFDVGRSPNDHYGFGAPGPHFCLGTHLARREITVMWRSLLSRTPRIHATSEPSRLESNFVNGIKHLPYSFE
jgi:cytochrome P450